MIVGKLLGVSRIGSYGCGDGQDHTGALHQTCQRAIWVNVTLADLYYAGLSRNDDGQEQSGATRRSRPQGR